MLTFPRRSKNGYIDLGKEIGTPGETCPNCGSPQYSETISTEHCPACGLFYDYWGGGANEIYAAMVARRVQEEEERERLLQIKLEHQRAHD